VTWVSAEEIRDSARLYATSKPACMSVGVALEQSTNSFNTLRAAYNLVALTGNVDVPGGNTFWENPLPGARMKALVARDRVSPEAAARMIGDFPLVDGSSPGHTIWRAIVTGEPYPVRAVLVHGSNPLLTQEDPSGLVEKALRQVEFLVASDMFLTPTAQLADLVLPAATYLEKDDVNLRGAAWRGPGRSRSLHRDLPADGT
jgi:anaerobic selenocysteine-containing dehydrogenase